MTDIPAHREQAVIPEPAITTYTETPAATEKTSDSSKKKTSEIKE